MPLDTKAFLEIDTNLVIIRIDVIEIFLFIRCEICEIAATIANSICSELSVCSNRTNGKKEIQVVKVRKSLSRSLLKSHIVRSASWQSPIRMSQDDLKKKNQKVSG